MAERIVVDIGGRLRTVSVARESAVDRTSDTPGSRSSHRYEVEVDGVRHVVDAWREPATRWSLIIDAQSFDLTVTAVGPGCFRVESSAGSLTATLSGSRARHDAAHASTDGRITSPMPGKVVKVLVKVGDLVEVHQPVVVVEAMKMENELRAPIGGRVVEVAVNDGMLVDAGRLLVAIA